jgi:hypothetical protein
MYFVYKIIMILINYYNYILMHIVLTTCQDHFRKSSTVFKITMRQKENDFHFLYIVMFI